MSFPNAAAYLRWKCLYLWELFLRWAEVPFLLPSREQCQLERECSQTKDLQHVCWPGQQGPLVDHNAHVAIEYFTVVVTIDRALVYVQSLTHRCTGSGVALSRWPQSRSLELCSMILAPSKLTIANPYLFVGNLCCCKKPVSVGI